MIEEHQRQLIELNGKWVRVAWFNNKTGDEYKVLFDAMNCTNDRNGQMMVVYTNGEKNFVRDKAQFEQKFRRVVFEPKCFICGTTQGLYLDTPQGRGVYRCHGDGCVAF
jgi:hypothetical protein